MQRAIQGVIEEANAAGGIRGRLGGDEFVVALAVPPDQALAHAEHLRAAVQSLEFPDQPGLDISISVGLATPPPGGHLRSWLEAADAALYRAKHGGRNRTETLQPREPRVTP